MSNVVGIFDDHESARTAISLLREAEFSSGRISVIAADAEGHAHRNSVDASGNVAAEGALSGLTSGAAVGGLLGVLVGMGAVFVPGGILLAGPIAGLAAGAAAGAATGGLLGGLAGLGIPKEHADVMAESVRRGAVLVSVDAGDRQAEAERCLREAGAADVEERASRLQEEGWSGYDPNAAPYAADQVQSERDRYRPSSINTDSQGRDPYVGLNATTSIPGSSGIGTTGGSLTDTSTGLGLGSVGTGTPGVPSTMSGNPAEGADTGSIGASYSDSGIGGDNVPETAPAFTGTAHNFTDRGSPLRSQEKNLHDDHSAGSLPFRDEEDRSDILGRVDLPDASGHTEATDASLDRDSASESAERESAGIPPSLPGGPAYEFGLQARRRSANPSLAWGDVESALKQEWEQFQPGTWEANRATVQVAWHTSRPENGAKLL